MLSVLLSGLAVIGLTFLLVLGANALMDRFLQAELEATREAILRAEKSDEAARKAEQQEIFYQTYKTRENYQYYGQYYELFNNVYNADTIFIGTSHGTHGVNPLHFEADYPHRSFYNFSLNGTVPSYYLQWYQILKNEAKYPVPDTVIYCVDWFMCDSGWLWRRMSFDEPADMPLGIVRALRELSAPAPEESAAESMPEETEKSLQRLLRDSVAENGLLDLEEHLTVLLTNTPIFSSRDRIPEMVQYFCMGEQRNSAGPGQTVDPGEGIPVYEHEYLKDYTNNVTSLFYKGYIPWEVSYPGDAGELSCVDNPEEWAAFELLLDEFQKDNVTVIFVQAPEYCGVTSAMRTQNNEKILAIARERGIPFLNYNGEPHCEIRDDPSNYSDWGHLNGKGSTAFSKQLCRDLAEYLG